MKKMKKKKKTAREIIKDIPMYLWVVDTFIVLPLILLIFRIGSDFGLRFSVPFFLIFGGVWVLLTILTFLRSAKEDKAKKESKIDVFLEDPYFGEMTFTLDDNDGSHDLNEGKTKVMFGKYNPELHIDNYDESKKELYFRGLEYVYSIQDEIIKSFYEDAKGLCDDWGEHFENGDPLTKDYIEEEFRIPDIDIRLSGEDVTIKVWGWPGEVDSVSLLGDHNFSAMIDCTTKEVDYNFEG
jgi:hypothetical protein